jgi:hypothetical protein
MDSRDTLEEIIDIVSRRSYYASARIKTALVRSDKELAPVGGYVVLSDKPPAQGTTLDYGSLVLVETAISPEAFIVWTSKLVTDGTASLAQFTFATKGDFESPTWDYERFMPSDYEHFPAEWGCNFYKFKLASQASLPSYLPVKNGLPLYPDGNTAWGQWMKIEPGRFDLPGKFLFLLPNMEARVDRVMLSSKNIRISVVAGKGKLAGLKGKLYVQEAYTGSYRPSVHKDLTFTDGTAEIPIDFKPGMVYLTLSSSKDNELVDMRRSYVAYPGKPGLELDLSSEELERVIQQGENETTEFKAEISKNHMEFAETLVGFSNLRGGVIIVGVDEHGDVKGLQDLEITKMDERIQNFSRELCDPPTKFTLKRVELQGKVIVVVEVPEGSAKPYWLKNRGPIIRSGSTDRVMSRVEAQQLFVGGRGPFG